ncbi:MAG: M15 family metallopeptidase [bacterium]
MRRFKRVFISLLYLFVLFSPIAILAADVTQNLAPEPSIKIPGFEGFSKITRDVGNAGLIRVPYIAEYVAALYRYAVGAGAIIAAFMITVGGFQYVLSAGEPGRVGPAKKRIQDALVGFLLLIGSYILLYSINPNYVKLESIALFSVPHVELQDRGTESEQVSANESTSFDTNFNLSNCPDLVSIEKSGFGFGPRAHSAARKDTAEALTKVAVDWQIAYPGKTLTINRDYRTTGEQQYLYDAYKAGKGAKAAEPGHSNHERGNAVDISTDALTTEAYTRLIKIMENNGFKLLADGTYTSANVPEKWNTISERWHFDYVKGGAAKTIQCKSSAAEDQNSQKSLPVGRR